jgi:general secretion pathway protein D
MKLNKAFKILVATLILTVTLSAEEMVNVNIRNMGVKEFVQMVGKILKKNVLINGDLKGKINFIATEPIKTSSLLSLSNSILASKGYAMVDKGDFMEVVKASEAAGMGLEVSEDVSSGTMKTVLFPLKTSNAAVIRAKIRPLLHKNAKVVSFKNNNVLAVTAYPRTLQAIKKLIESLENAGRKGSTIIRLKNASSKDVYTNASAMAKKLFPQTVASEKVDIFKDEATNSIILVGKKDNVDRMIAYIKELDVPGQSVEQKMYVIPLKNSNVEDMEKILSKLVAQMNSMATTGAKKGQKAKKAMVVGDAERNALIVLATGDQIKNIREVVRRIDVEKAQVYIVAKIVEINVGAAERIGVEYSDAFGAANIKGLLSIGQRDNVAAFKTLTKLPGLSGLTSFYPAGTTALAAFFGLNAKINFLKTNGAAQILSQPSVLCTNNKESEIYVGQVRSILTSSASGDNKNDNTRNSYSREDIGITLKVKPRLSSNNKVALEVEANIEDIDPGDSVAADLPTTTKRKVNTNAIVNNGQTIILGGLIKSSNGESVKKIPLLGDIPILGELFRTTSNDTRKINVVIYLTPYIVRKSSDLVKLKEFLNSLNSIQARYDEILLRRLGKKPGQHNFAKPQAPRGGSTHHSAMEILNGRHGRSSPVQSLDGGGNY